MSSTRDRLVEAAAEVMSTLGLARTTTKEIARASGYSEATLYKNFRDKEELFLCVLHERMPQFVDTLKQLPERAGRDTVRDNVHELVRTALDFYYESLPLAASIFSEPRLLDRHREAMHREGAGPQQALRGLATYLSIEQTRGRVPADVNTDAAASLLLGACFQRAFLQNFLGEKPSTDDQRRFADEIIATIFGGLSVAGKS